MNITLFGKQMTRVKSVAICLGLLGVLATDCGATDNATSLTAQQVAERVYHRDVGEDMEMVGIMELISKSGHVRTRQMTTRRKDTPDERKVMIRFLSPADIKGTAFLVIEDVQDHSTRQHLYLPALKRTRRIVAAQQGRSFVNSDFTYEDMQRHPLDEWTYRLDAEQMIAGRNCYKLISTPKPDTETQYRKIASWIDRETFLPLKTIFWNKKSQPFKTYTVQTFKIVDGIATEMDVLMEDHDDEHKTRLKTQTVRYNCGLPDHQFTTRAMER